MDKKNLTIIVLLLVLVAIISGGTVYMWQQNNKDESVSEITTAQETSEETNTSDPENLDQPEAQASDEELISDVMATRHSRSVSEVDLTINENTGSHASGLVIFDGDIGGGWWLAAKVNDEWIVVADGNGTVLCDDINPYNFPTDMVPECWDETTQTLITR